MHNQITTTRTHVLNTILAESKQRVREFLLAESEGLEDIATPEADNLNEKLLALLILLN